MTAHYPEPITRSTEGRLVPIIAPDGDPAPALLEAGQVTAFLAGLELRDIRVAGDGLLAFVRPFVTLPSGRVEPCELRCMSCTTSGDRVAVAMHAMYRSACAVLATLCAVSVEADIVSYVFVARALTRFGRERIGLELGVPRDLASGVCGVVGVFEDRADAPLAHAGHLPALRDGLTGLSLPVRSDLVAQIAFEGEAFELDAAAGGSCAEMRCAPSAAVRTLEVQPGTEIRQSLTIRLLATDRGG